MPRLLKLSWKTRAVNMPLEHRREGSEGWQRHEIPAG
jgi:hypothetical protein